MEIVFVESDGVSHAHCNCHWTDSGNKILCEIFHVLIKVLICRKIYKRAGQALNLNLSQNCDSSFLLEKNSRTSYFKCDAFD